MINTDKKERIVNLSVFGVGISTGGSFTDAVIMDLSNWHVISKAKSPTTYYDFSVGIINSLDKVLSASQIPKNQVRLVSVATTLATNAIIEGRGERVGLILIGMNPADLQITKPENAKELPIQRIVGVAGGHGPDGIEMCSLDVNGVTKAVKEMGEGVDAFAVSGLFSVRNPEHEWLVKRIIQKSYTNPVVCGHELTGQLGIYERTVTAVLNARIIPIIERLINDVKNALAQRGISAPLMLVRGDGALMNEVFALERAIEMVQSGPAASVIGGKFLSSKDNVVVIDIGSTTTIISSVKEGSAKTDESGVTIVGWKTRVKAVDADALGNGGDSLVWTDERGELKVGPRRVIPLAFATKDFPNLKEKIVMYDTTDFLTASKAMKKPNGSEITQRFIEAINRLEPVTIQELKKELKDIPTIELLAGMMDEGGYIARIGLTPTDLMHVKGLFTAGDSEAAKMGVELLAKRINVTLDELYDRVWRIMVHKIVLRVAERELYGNGVSITSSDAQKSYLEVLDRVVGGSLGDIKIGCSLKVPIVGIGAPASLFIPEVGKKLQTEAIIPPDHEVGAAIGALVGNVVMSMDLQIRKEIKPEQYVVFPGRHIFQDLEAAAEYAIKMGKKETLEKATRAGAVDIDFKVERKDKVLPNVGFMWSELRVTAAGRPGIGGGAT